MRDPNTPARVRARIDTLLSVGCVPQDARSQAWGEYRHGDLGGWPRFWRKRKGLHVNSRGGLRDWERNRTWGS